MRRTRIIATVGPATDTDDKLDALISAGVDIVRLNFSHGTHESQGAMYARVRQAALRAGRAVAILQDLGGPKIRTGRLEGGRPIDLTRGDQLIIASGDFIGGPGRISTTFEGLAHGVRTGDRLLLSDGSIDLRVDRSNGHEVHTTVMEGGRLGQHKGINAPGVELPASAITPKDVDDLHFGLELGVDMVAISYVSSADDLHRVRSLLAASTVPGAAEMPLIAKLERPQALARLDEILAASDGVMIARGDLGLEMPFERVPRAQKEMTVGARRRQIPVIVATQVLESMTTEPRPTRAEVNDAANAVDDGVDGIMLAGETASGAYPARSVETLDAIIRDAESGPFVRRLDVGDVTPHDHQQAVCEAAVSLAERGDAQAIVAVTRRGGTARRLSALRPSVPIIAIAQSEATARRLSLYWGITPLFMQLGNGQELSTTEIARALIDHRVATEGASVVFVNISPDLTRHDANFLRIHRL